MSSDPARERKLVRWGGLAAALAACVATWEYLLMAAFNPEVAWSPWGVAAHGLIDAALLFPVAALSLAAAAAFSRRFGGGASRGAAWLGWAGVAMIAWTLLAVPVTGTRDLVHDELGARSGLYLAEIQTTVVTSDLTVQEATQLCSFGSVRNPSLARDLGFEATLVQRARAAARDALVQLAMVLPILLGGLWLAGRRRDRAVRRFDPAPVAVLGELATAGWRRHARLAGVGLLGSALFCTGAVIDRGSVDVAFAGYEKMAPIFDACRDGGPVREYSVSAIDVDITLNRWGDYVENAFMYALDANVAAIREFEEALARDRELDDTLGVSRVSHGLRDDLIQPLVIRANLGECLRVHFTNKLEDGEPASMHILGLPHTVTNASSAVGNNPDSTAGTDQTVTYEIPLPLDVDAERAYYMHDHGAGRRRQNMGLFGAIVAEPQGATYLDVETGEPLDTETGSNWEAIIVDPNLEGHEDGKSFREFVILYHEIGDEAFTDIRDRDGKKMPLIDEIAGVYRPAARAINYRSEPFRRRLEVESTGKSLGYASYPFGDPATPIPRSYLGEGVKTRLLHGGSEVFHVHHLHGGGDRWRRNPNADPNNDFWKGLTKVPDPNLTSIHLDSQSIGPGTSYNLEHECGAGGCQQGAGDFLFHCHIGHHYISGMWSFWRVFDTTQTVDSNLYGRPLAVVPALFQNPGNPLIAPSPPEDGVSAGDLVGLVVDGKTLVAEDRVVDPGSQISLRSWLGRQLPPQGVRLDKQDATVWNWIVTGSGADLQVWGEPESDEPFAGYVSETPGERPEVMFNPKNGRYTWPLFRPQKGQRPPFTARHTGAPWLGEQMTEGRLDGLCAQNGVHPSVDIGQNFKRFYPVSSIAMPIQVTPDRMDEDGQIFVLNEEEEAVRSGAMPTDPLTIRSNVGDCVEITFTNKIPDGPLNKDFSKTNIHSHFVQFDTQASDGVITGMSYEQSVRPIESENRSLTSSVAEGSTSLPVNHTDRLRPGIWIGVGLGEGTCGTNAQGQPVPCTEIVKITGLSDTSITIDRPLRHDHESGESVGVEFVRYHWYSDVDFGTVFFHTHVEFKDWDHGLFGTHIVEPKGSSYHDPATGEPVRSGSLVDIRVDPTAGGNPAAWNIDGSFREFVLYLHDNNPAEGPFVRGGGTINLRAEPWRLREEADPAWRFSSVTHGDPMTPLVRAYAGDPVVIRGMGVVERVGGVRFTGHRFQQERNNANSDTRDSTFIGISERFDVSLEGGAGGPNALPGDYLYYSTLGRDFEAGAWGLLRVHDTRQESLQPLPDRPAPAEGSGFPQQAFTGGAPERLMDGPGNVCPADAPRRTYTLDIKGSQIIYNRLTARDDAGVAYRLAGRGSATRSTPLVLRANHGDCLELNLLNLNDRRAGISLGELVFDPQRSYGAAIGYNYDTTIAPGQGQKFRYYADRELGLTLGVNLADAESIERGAFAGVVVEPEGAVYFRPGRDEPLLAGGAGVQADIEVDGVRTREFVALFNDEDRRIGQNAMPYPDAVERFAGINYSHEPLDLRDMRGRPADVFKSSMWGDPRHVVTVPAGQPLVYRVGHAWGNQVHVPTLEGHRWYLEKDMPGSEQVFNDVLVPGLTLDLHMVGGAGGDIAAPGDYLFLDRRQPFLEFGLWNLLRVTDDGTSGADDRVTIVYTNSFPQGGGQYLGVRGRTTIRPAGDYAGEVQVHRGPSVDGGCTGEVLGSSRIDPGSGDFFYQAIVPSVPDEVCVASTGGGVADRRM